MPSVNNVAINRTIGTRYSSFEAAVSPTGCQLHIPKVHPSGYSEQYVSKWLIINMFILCLVSRGRGTDQPLFGALMLIFVSLATGS